MTTAYSELRSRERRARRTRQQARPIHRPRPYGRYFASAFMASFVITIALLTLAGVIR